MIAGEDQFPWDGVPPVLHFSSATKFQTFLSAARDATASLCSSHHFDSLTSLIDLHNRYVTSGKCQLEEVWRDIPVDHCENMKELTCVGLALELKKLITENHPDLDDYLALGITNEWTSKEAVSESFWKDTSPPSFPLQCREHSLLFVRVRLEDDRNAVVLLDPGRCSAPKVVTEDGLPPQSPTVVFKRYKKTREHTASWGGTDYMRWTIGTRKEDSYTETLLRVYVGRRFKAGSYLDWFNLIFPYRAVFFMTLTDGLGLCLRVEVGGARDHVVIVRKEKGAEGFIQVDIPFNSEDQNLDETQVSCMKELSDKVGGQTLLSFMDKLKVVLNDQDFAEQFWSIWKKGKQDTEDSLIVHRLN